MFLLSYHEKKNAKINGLKNMSDLYPHFSGSPLINGSESNGHTGSFEMKDSRFNKNKD